MAAASTLSLVFPETNFLRAQINLEAALLHLVTTVEGEKPRYNKRMERLKVEGPGRASLSEAETHLRLMADRILRALERSIGE